MHTFINKINSLRRRGMQSGSILILSLIIILGISAIGLSLVQAVATQYGTHKQQLNVENAVSAAEAGISASLAQLNLGNTGVFNTEQTMYSSSSRGKATYTTTVTTDSNNNNVITSTGRVYRLTTDTTPANTKVIRAVTAIKKDKITNSLIFGSGNLYLSQSSGFPSGDVYIRGQLSMEQYAGIGSSTQSVNVNIANVGCGNSTNWPQPCGASSPPIKMINSTPGAIYGTVCATNQTSGTGIYPGPTGSGLAANCSPRVSAAPTFNKKAFISAVKAANPGGTSPSNFQCGFFNSTVTIPANTYINGDLTFTPIFGNCTIYISGDVYISGGLTLNPGAILRVADSVGTIRPTIVVNNSVGFYVSGGNNDLFLPNSSGTPFYLITFASTNTTCSTSETVPSDIVQTCLTPSQAQASAASVPYTTGGSATVNGTGAILYAYYGGFSMSNDITARFYGFGSQGGWVGARTQIITTGTDAPFANILSFPSYKVADYQQVY